MGGGSLSLQNAAPLSPVSCCTEGGWVNSEGNRRGPGNRRERWLEQRGRRDLPRFDSIILAIGFVLIVSAVVVLAALVLLPPTGGGL
jgi:hypothetical protein